MNISNLEVCCLAYDKQFDQLKAKIDADPDCVKKKDRVCTFFFTYQIATRSSIILGWAYCSSLGLFKWCERYCSIFT